jgi:hypothetical protein
MKTYKVLFANEGVLVIGLERAREFAKNKSLVNFRASIFDGNTKVATYEWGKVKSLA